MMSRHLRIFSGESTARVLVFNVSDDLWRAHADALSSGDCQFSRVATLAEACHQLNTSHWDVCLTSVDRSVNELLEILRTVEANRSATQVVAFTADGQIPEACDTNSASAHSGRLFCLDNESSARRLGTAIDLAAERAQLLSENERLRRQVRNRTYRELVGHSSAVLNLKREIQGVADEGCPVLINSAPGAEAGVVAQAIHDASPVGHRPLIRIQCGVLSSEQLERELIGGEETPDLPASQGRLGQAEGSTLFLDEVETIAVTVQRSLLRLLQSGHYRDPITRDVRQFKVRIVAASYGDLEAAVRRGEFREDLYRFLRASTVTVPGLSERLEDIGLLAEHFLTQAAHQEGRPSKRLTVEALSLLRQHAWPGNVAQLRNAIFRACAVDVGPMLTAADIAPWLEEVQEDTGPVAGVSLKEMERKLIEATFARCAGNRERTAQMLQIGLRTLSGKLREYGYPPRGGPGSNLVRRNQARAA